MFLGTEWRKGVGPAKHGQGRWARGWEKKAMPPSVVPCEAVEEKGDG
jgi:hypothetical protein